MRKQPKIDEDYVVEGAESTTEEDLDSALENRAGIEEKFNAGMLKKYAEMCRLMFCLLNDYRRGRYRQVPWLTIAAISFTLLYVWNPFDMVPDFIPLLGYVDDLSVLTLGLNFMETDLHSYVNWRAEDDEDIDTSR